MSAATYIYMQVVGMTPTNVAQLMVFIFALYLLWQRMAERRSKSKCGKKTLLPSPRRLLPSWFGMISGHTLLVKNGEVRAESVTRRTRDRVLCHDQKYYHRRQVVHPDSDSQWLL